MPRFLTRIPYTIYREVEVEAKNADSAARRAIHQAPETINVLGNELLEGRRAIHGHWDVEVEEIKEDEDGSV